MKINDNTPPEGDASIGVCKGLPNLHSTLREAYFEIFPRDLEQPAWAFVGRLAECDNRTGELLLCDQDGHLYYLRDFHQIDEAQDYLAIRSEFAETGEDLEGVIDAVREVYEGSDIENWFPPLLAKLQRSK
jgi:hypothetical protein